MQRGANITTSEASLPVLAPPRCRSASLPKPETWRLRCLGGPPLTTLLSGDSMRSELLWALPTLPPIRANEEDRVAEHVWDHLLSVLDHGFEIAHMPRLPSGLRPTLLVERCSWSGREGRGLPVRRTAVIEIDCLVNSVAELNYAIGNARRFVRSADSVILVVVDPENSVPEHAGDALARRTGVVVVGLGARTPSGSGARVD